MIHIITYPFTTVFRATQGLCVILKSIEVRVRNACVDVFRGQEFTEEDLKFFYSQTHNIQTFVDAAIKDPVQIKKLFQVIAKKEKDDELKKLAEKVSLFAHYELRINQAKEKGIIDQILDCEKLPSKSVCYTAFIVTKRDKLLDELGINQPRSETLSFKCDKIGQKVLKKFTLKKPTLQFVYDDDYAKVRGNLTHNPSPREVQLRRGKETHVSILFPRETGLKKCHVTEQKYEENSFGVTDVLSSKFFEINLNSFLTEEGKRVGLTTLELQSTWEKHLAQNLADIKNFSIVNTFLTKALCVLKWRSDTTLRPDKENKMVCSEFALYTIRNTLEKMNEELQKAKGCTSPLIRNPFKEVNAGNVTPGDVQVLLSPYGKFQDITFND